MKINLIVYVITTIVIFIWLFSILGRRNGHEKQRESFFDVTPETNTSETKEKSKKIIDITPDSFNEEIFDNKAHISLVEKMQDTDPAFSPDNFVYGVKKIFPEIVHAFYQSDTKKLKTFLTAELYDIYEKEIKKRDQQTEKKYVEIETIKKVTIHKIELQASTALITAHIFSQQVHYTKNQAGEIKGDQNQLHPIEELCGFKRNLTSEDRAWYLYAMRQL